MSSLPGSGRQRVLAQIRQSLGRGADSTVDILPLQGQGPRPAFSGPLVDRFIGKMQEKAASVQRLGSLFEVGVAVASYVTAVPAGPALRVSQALKGIDWPAHLTVQHGAAVREDETSVTPCFAAVAESGGIVTLSGPDTPSTLNFVPDTHIVVVHTHQVVAHLEDVFERLGASVMPLPRTLNIISGPSRTADIEQTIQLGAHGPRRLHILLVGN
jgi:L-lactate dehydrogenase complex protein LldG